MIRINFNLPVAIRAWVPCPSRRRGHVSPNPSMAALRLAMAPSVFIAVLAAALTVTPIAHAADVDWIDPLGGDFNDGGNWSAGVPGVGDTAIFDLATGGYTVTFPANVTTGGLRIREDTVTFSLGGFEYQLIAVLNLGLSFTSSKLTIANGTLRVDTAPIEVFLGSATNAFTEIVLQTPAVMKTNAALRLGVASGSTGIITLQADTVLNVNTPAGGVFLGSNATATGEILLFDGAGVNAGAMLTVVGLSGDGSLQVFDSVYNADDLHVAELAGATGDLLVLGPAAALFSQGAGLTSARGEIGGSLAGAVGEGIITFTGLDTRWDLVGGDFFLGTRSLGTLQLLD